MTIEQRRIYVKAVPKAGKNQVKKVAENEYKVWITATPERGKANKVLLKLLAEYFGVSKSNVQLVAGQTARIKIVDVLVDKN